MSTGKLLLSKWTAVSPKNKEKHFLVTKLIKNEEEVVVTCILEAVYSRTEYTIEASQLKNSDQWLIGWQ